MGGGTSGALQAGGRRFKSVSAHNWFEPSGHPDNDLTTYVWIEDENRKFNLLSIWSPDEDFAQESRDGLANLQLLEGIANIEKQQMLPAEWLAEMYPDDASRADYCDKHLLGEVPAQIVDFPKFFNERRTKLRERISRMLELSGPASDGGTAAPEE